MLALLDVVDSLMDAQSGVIDPTRFEALVLQHLRAHLDAYGDEIWTPKFHYALHLAHHLLMHGCLPSTFVLERKHKVTKRACEGRRNLTSFDRGVLEEVTLQHFYDLQSPLVSVVCVRAHKANSKQRQALSSLFHINEDKPVEVSGEAKVLNRSIVMGDVAAFQEDGNVHLGDVYLHAIIDDQHWTCISEWDVVEKPRPFVTKCRVGLQPRIVKTDCFLESGIFSRPANVGGIATILMPSKYA